MRKRVAFVTFYFEAWDSLAEVYARMLDDPRFEVLVVAIPRKLTGDSAWDDASGVSDFFAAQGIDHIIGSADSSELREWAPDYVFINYPWQRNYQPAYRADEVVKFTRIAYVPYYSLPLVNELGTDGHAALPGSDGRPGVAEHLYTQRSHQLASLVFTQDRFVREAYAATSRGADHVFFTGSPKVDALIHSTAAIEAARVVETAAHRHANGGRTQVVWAPHHSYSPHWLNFGTFAQNYLEALDWATEHPEIDVCLRPHPFMFGTLVDREVISDSDLDAWLAAWDALENTSIDSVSGPPELFVSCDVLLTDGISFLAEYPLVTGKPSIFIENQGHWEFSELGELAARASVRLSSFAEFAAGFDFILEAGLPDRSAEIAALREASSPYPGEAAARIIEVVAADHSGLVDPSTVTEVPWERRPGREPLDD
jgi:CDP-glycerol glycerophosphotransferase (TagB/SpsB family)